jgi:hypothetical protein
MKIKFKTPYADADAGYKAGQEYDFIDTRKASYFIDHGIAVPVEQAVSIGHGLAVVPSIARKAAAEVEARRSKPPKQ